MLTTRMGLVRPSAIALCIVLWFSNAGFADDTRGNLAWANDDLRQPLVFQTTAHRAGDVALNAASSSNAGVHDVEIDIEPLLTSSEFSAASEWLVGSNTDLINNSSYLTGDDAHGEGCDCCGILGRFAARDLWKMPQPCLFQKLGIKTGGWVEAGLTLNSEHPVDKYNGPVLANDRDREPQLNELWLYFERAIDTGGCGFDIGGRVDIFYGTDWRVAQYHGFGLEDRINRGTSLYGFSPAQFYMEVGVNKLSLKMGRMTGILGYEIIPPVGNFFYSRSYAFSYAEPLLITGMMAKYPMSDRLTVLAGFHQGIHRFEDNNNVMNFQGGFTWTSCDGRDSLAYAVDTGRNDAAAVEDEYVHSIVFKHQVSKRLLYVLQNDLGHRNNVAGLGGADAEWYGINQYLLYTINPCWSAGIRAEWLRDDDGVIVLGLDNLPQGRGWTGAPGYAGNFYEVTLGLNWTPNSSVSIRPEARWDWYDGLANAAGPYPLPYDDGTSRNQFTFAVDLIYTF